MIVGMEPTICINCHHCMHVRIGDDGCAATPYEGGYQIEYVSGWTSPVESGYKLWGSKWFAYCKDVNTDGKCPKYKQCEVATEAPPKKPWWKLW